MSAKRNPSRAREGPEFREPTGIEKGLADYAGNLEARLRSATRALQVIAEHTVGSIDDPCDWHCTRLLTDIAKAELESLGDGQQAGADR